MIDTVDNNLRLTTQGSLNCLPCPPYIKFIFSFMVLCHRSSVSEFVWCIDFIFISTCSNSPNREINFLSTGLQWFSLKQVAFKKRFILDNPWIDLCVRWPHQQASFMSYINSFSVSSKPSIQLTKAAFKSSWLIVGLVLVLSHLVFFCSSSLLV